MAGVATENIIPRSFKKRADSVFAGFELLIESLAHSEAGDEFPGELRDEKEAAQIIARAKAALEAYKRSLASDVDYKKAYADYKNFFGTLCGLVGESSTSIDAKKASKHLQHAEALMLWERERPEPLISTDSILGLSIAQQEDYQTQFTEEQRRELWLCLASKKTDRPTWFKGLTLWEQKYLRKELQRIGMTEGNYLSVKLPWHILSSLWRPFPVLSSYSKHSLQIGGTTVSQRVRSGIVVPYAIKEEEALIAATELNIRQLIEDHAAYFLTEREKIWGPESGISRVVVNIQTLIAPIKSDEGKMLIAKMQAIEELTRENGELKLTVGQGVKKREITIVLTGTNIPLDVASRGFSRVRVKDPFQVNEANDLLILREMGGFLQRVFGEGEYTQVVNFFKTLTNLRSLDEAKVDWVIGKINQLLGTIDQDTRFNPEQRWRLKLLLNASRNFLQIWQSGEFASNALFLAALEEIIVEQIGGVSTGSCKSGKDRKGMETLFLDVMLIYFQKYKTLPPYDSEDPNFNNLFAELFLESTHKEEFAASLTAPGAFGIKNIRGVLPKGLRKAINEKSAQMIRDLVHSWPESDMKKDVLAIAQEVEARGEGAVKNLRALIKKDFDMSSKLRMLSEKYRGDPQFEAIYPRLQSLAHAASLSARLADLNKIKKLTEEELQVSGSDQEQEAGQAIAGAMGAIPAFNILNLTLDAVEDHLRQTEKGRRLTCIRRTDDEDEEILVFGSERDLREENENRCCTLSIKTGSRGSKLPELSFYDNLVSSGVAAQVVDALDARAFTISETQFNYLKAQGLLKDVAASFHAKNIELQFVPDREYDLTIAQGDLTQLKTVTVISKEYLQTLEGEKGTVSGLAWQQTSDDGGGTGPDMSAPG